LAHQRGGELGKKKARTAERGQKRIASTQWGENGGFRAQQGGGEINFQNHKGKAKGVADISFNGRLIRGNARGWGG